jgi:hypothetical protein
MSSRWELLFDGLPKADEPLAASREDRFIGRAGRIPKFLTVRGGQQQGEA